MKLKFNPNSYFTLLLMVIFCVFFILNNLGIAYISGSSNFWKIQDSDITQHISGLNLYLSSPWQFPLLAFDGLNYPQGTRVTFIDGIPIFAFFLKVLLPRDIGYISPLGYWSGLSFILQGVAAWWITRELQIKSWSFLIFLSLVFLTYPAFIQTSPLVALSTHWIILFAIALYLRGTRLASLPVIGWTALLACAFYIHIYLFVMALGIYVAAAFETKHYFTWQHIFSLLFPLVFLVFSLFIFLLPLPPGPVQSPNDIDIYAINLLSPISGEKLRPFHLNLSHNPRGGNNLGLGVIIVFLWTIFFNCKANFKTCKKHLGLFIILLAYFLFSLSNKIYFSGHLIASFTYPDFFKPIASQFRGCGRFFWPVGYVIVIYSTCRLYCQFKNKKIFAFIICILLAIQYIDIHGSYSNLRSHHHEYPVKNFLNDSELNAILKNSHIKYIYLYPKYGCLKHKDYTMQVITPMMQYAAMHQLKLNTGFIARYGSDCEHITKEIEKSEKNYSVYIFSKMAYSNLNQVYLLIGNKNKVACSDLKDKYICHFLNQN